MKLSNIKNLLLPASFLVLFFICCNTSSQQQKTGQPEKIQQQPMPAMEPQVDSLKKVLDEKRKSRK